MTRPGETVPDSRGRTGLHTRGTDLDRSPDVVVKRVEVTSDGWHVLRRTTLDLRLRDGTWQEQQRETYDRGDGATVLLYAADTHRLLLTRQFRYPAYVNGHPDGMLVEEAGRGLDEDSPEDAIRREAREELGVEVVALTHLFDLFMSPGSVTERVHHYLAAFAPADVVGAGGGVADEGEDIERIEVTLEEALAMVADGRIADGKTVILIQHVALHGFPG
jgi:nudix-type nucleoside diphosphatase (YffH/AdpP family)